MSHGEHSQCSRNAGRVGVRKGLVAVLSLMVTTVVAISTPTASASHEAFDEPIARKQITTSPQTTGPGGPLSWGLDRIDQRTVVSGSRSYGFSTDGTGVTLYVLDSGVTASHPEFGGRVAPGWSYRSSSTALTSYRNALAANQSNPNTGIPLCTLDRARHSHPFDPVGFDAPQSVDSSDVGQTDNDGHGTHVAAIAAGDGVGVAKNVTIVPVRALDSCGNGTRTMILEALAWILADHDAGEKAVLNLSVGFGEQVTSVDNAITSLMNEGVVVVAAAGNDSATACGSTPASTLGTISVGSMNEFDRESSFSNFGQCVDIFAPGSSVYSAYPFENNQTNTYKTISGTSMASPFVAGAIARYLQLLQVAPTNFSNGSSAAWTWLNTNATLNAITYYNANRSPQTPNKLLYVATTPPQVSALTALPADGGAVVSWGSVVTEATYTATASPGNATCSVVAATTCTISGLTNGTSYTVTVVGSNSAGSGPIATTTVVAGQVPDAPPSASLAVQSQSVTLQWLPTNVVNPTYVVTSVPASAGCSTTQTTCTITGLKYGVNYTFSISVKSSTGLVSAASTNVVARPGFTVRRSVVKRGSRTVLTSFLSTPSKGKKTWRESGSCSISRGRLVAPKRKTTCTVILTVAKWGRYPKMSTTLKVTVS